MRVEFGVLCVQDLRLPPSVQILVNIRQAENDNGYGMVLTFCPVDEALKRFSVIRSYLCSYRFQALLRMLTFFRGKAMDPVQIIVPNPNHDQVWKPRSTQNVIYLAGQ